MDHLKKPEISPSVALMSGGTPGATSPVSPDHRNSPYGHGGNGRGSGSGYLAANAANNEGGAYEHSISSLNLDQYGAPATMAVRAGQQSPRPDYGGPYGQNQTSPGYSPSPSPLGYDRYGMGPARGSASPMPSYSVDGYGADVRRSPAPQSDYGFGADVRRSPAPQSDRGYDQSQQYPSRNGYSRPYPPMPQRNYSSDSSRPLVSRPGSERPYSNNTPPSPNLQNNSGFDFNSGFSRPQQYNNSTRSSGRQAYPGYRAYQP